MSKPVGIIIVDTGYQTATPSDPKIKTLAIDFRPDSLNSGGVPIRPDGTDSVPDGSGTKSCNIVSWWLGKQPNQDYMVFSLKAGDGRSVDPFAIQPALKWVATLPDAFPDWNWVTFLNWTLPAIGQAKPIFPALKEKGIPLVFPSGNYGIKDCDPLLSGGGILGEYIPTYDNLLCATNCNGEGEIEANYECKAGDTGVKTVHLAVPAMNSVNAALAATAWVATSYLVNDGGDPVGRVKRLVVENGNLAGRVATGGMLVGGPR